MYEELGGIICRKAGLEDLQSVYDFILPFITDEKERRQLKKYIRYYVRTGSVAIVKSDDETIGMYAGKDNNIHYIACKGGPKAALLLFYTVLCGMHNKYAESHFIAFKENRHLFEKLRTPEGKVCIMDSEGKGVIPPLAKDYIEQLFRRFKK